LERSLNVAVLKTKDAKALDKKGRDEKLKDLRMELIKANVSAHKTNAKTKEIKRAIARLLTLDQAEKSGRTSKQ
jgi:ribosomal protein L29